MTLHTVIPALSVVVTLPDGKFFQGILVDKDGTAIECPADGESLCIGDGEGQPMLETCPADRVISTMTGWEVFAGRQRYLVKTDKVFH